MGKIAGIKGKSPEAYPPDNTGKPTISTESAVNPGPVALGLAPALPSLLPDGPIEAGSAGERIIVMFSGALQWPGGDEGPASATVTVGIYLDGSSTPAYSIPIFLPSSTVSPNPPQPVSFSLFWETPTDGVHAVDVKAQVTSGGPGADEVNGSLVLISTPV